MPLVDLPRTENRVTLVKRIREGKEIEITLKKIKIIYKVEEMNMNQMNKHMHQRCMDTVCNKIIMCPIMKKYNFSIFNVYWRNDCLN